MTPGAPTWPTVSELAAQQHELQWAHFREDDAWQLGAALVATARERSLPVAIDISRGGQQLFHAALAGTSADNDSWLLRKRRVVERFSLSSLHVGQICRDAGQSLEQVFAVSEREFAAHGGAFPLTVASAGVIGCVAVSGLPQLEDHALVVEVLRAVLGAPGAIPGPADLDVPSSRPAH
jgi:uncharacterized protein (UPF0303 family)